MGRRPASSASEYLVLWVAEADAFESEFVKEGKGLRKAQVVDGNTEADTPDEDENLRGQSILLKYMFFIVIFYVSLRCWGFREACLGLVARHSGVGDLSVDDTVATLPKGISLVLNSRFPPYKQTRVAFPPPIIPPTPFAVAVCIYMPGDKLVWRRG